MIHIREGQNQLVFNRHTPPHKTCVAALGYYADTPFVTPFYDLAHLVGSFWLEDGGGFALVFTHPVIVV